MRSEDKTDAAQAAAPEQQQPGDDPATAAMVHAMLHYRKLIRRRTGWIAAFWALLLCLRVLIYSEDRILPPDPAILLQRAIAASSACVWIFYAICEARVFFGRATVIATRAAALRSSSAKPVAAPRTEEAKPSPPVEEAHHGFPGRPRLAPPPLPAALPSFPGKPPRRAPPAAAPPAATTAPAPRAARGLPLPLPPPARLIMSGSPVKRGLQRHMLSSPTRKGAAQGLNTGPRTKPGFVLGRKLHCGEINSVPKDSFFGRLGGKTVGIETGALCESFYRKTGAPAGRSRVAPEVLDKKKDKIFSDTRAQHLAIVLAKCKIPLATAITVALEPMQIPRVVVAAPGDMITASATDLPPLLNQGLATVTQPATAASWIVHRDHQAQAGLGSGGMAQQQCLWCRHVAQALETAAALSGDASEFSPVVRRQCCMSILGCSSAGCLLHLSEDLDKLANVFPTAQEIDALRKYQGDLEDLRDIERKTYRLCMVAEAEARIRLWRYAFSLMPRWETARIALDRLTRCLQQVQESQSLQWCFIGVLEIVNFINAPQQLDTSRSQADDSEWKIKGVNLSDALKFNDFKSINSRFRLTHYLVLALNQKLFNRSAAAPAAADNNQSKKLLLSGSSMAGGPMLHDMEEDLSQMFPQNPDPKPLLHSSPPMASPLRQLHRLQARRPNTNDDDDCWDEPPETTPVRTADDRLEDAPIFSPLKLRCPDPADVGPQSLTDRPVGGVPKKPGVWTGKPTGNLGPISQATYRKVSAKFESITDNARKELPLLADCCKLSASGFEKQMQEAAAALQLAESDARRVRGTTPTAGTKAAPQNSSPLTCEAFAAIMETVPIDVMLAQSGTTMTQWTSQWDHVVKQSKEFLAFFCDQTATTGGRARGDDGPITGSPAARIVQRAVEALVEVNALVEVLEKAWNDVFIYVREFHASLPQCPYLLTEILREVNAVATERATVGRRTAAATAGGGGRQHPIPATTSSLIGAAASAAQGGFAAPQGADPVPPLRLSDPSRLYGLPRALRGTSRAGPRKGIAPVCDKKDRIMSRTRHQQQQLQQFSMLSHRSPSRKQSRRPVPSRQRPARLGRRLPASRDPCSRKDGSGSTTASSGRLGPIDLGRTFGRPTMSQSSNSDAMTQDPRGRFGASRLPLRMTIPSIPSSDVSNSSTSRGRVPPQQRIVGPPSYGRGLMDYPLSGRDDSSSSAATTRRTGRIGQLPLVPF